MLNNRYNYIYHILWPLIVYFFRMDDKISNNYALTTPVKHPNFPRMGHKVIQLDGEAYIIGGTTLDGTLIRTIFKFNLEKLKVQPLHTENSLGIEGFALFTYQGLIYLWGGNVQSHYSSPSITSSNTLWCFDGKKFSECEQLGEIPSPRAFHCSAWFANRFLVICGGYGKQLFTDWHIFDMKTRRWNQMIPTTQLPISTIFQIGWVNGRGILFTTEIVNHQNSTPAPILRNQLFELKILDFKSFRFRVQPLAHFQELKPLARSDPCLIFTGKQVFMLGGIKNPQIYSEVNGVQYGEFCNDSWIFDFQSLEWKKNSCIIFSQYGFSALKYKNKIFSFSGVKGPNMELSSAIEIISIDNEPDLVEDRFCNLCKYVYGLDKRLPYSKPSALTFLEENDEPIAQISSNFIAKIAELLQNPLNALGLLIDNSLNMSASTISIKLQTKQLKFRSHGSPQHELQYFQNSISYLQIGDNSEIFDIDEIIRLFHTLKWRIFPTTSDAVYEEELNLQNQYLNNLRLAGLRLAKSCLFISRTQNGEILVLYFSTNAFDLPESEKPMDCCYYKLQAQKNTETKTNKKEIKNKSCSNHIDRQIINRNLAHLISEEEYLDFTNFSTKLYLFDVQQLTTFQLSENFLTVSPNPLFFPLSQSQEKKTDIHLSITPSAGQFSSLYDLVRKMYLVPYLGRQIYIQNSKVAFVDMSEKFKEDFQKDLIEKISIPESQLNMFSRCCLYRITSISYSFASIFIYHQNRLISTITTKDRNLCGFIEIPKEIQVDIFKSKFAKIQDYRKLLHYIESKDCEKKRPNMRRNISQVNGELKEGRKMGNIDFCQCN